MALLCGQVSAHTDFLSLRYWERTVEQLADFQVFLNCWKGRTGISRFLTTLNDLQPTVVPHQTLFQVNVTGLTGYNTSISCYKLMLATVYQYLKHNKIL